MIYLIYFMDIKLTVFFYSIFTSDFILIKTDDDLNKPSLSYADSNQITNPNTPVLIGINS